MPKRRAAALPLEDSESDDDSVQESSMKRAKNVITSQPLTQVSLGDEDEDLEDEEVPATQEPEEEPEDEPKPETKVAASKPQAKPKPKAEIKYWKGLEPPALDKAYGIHRHPRYFLRFDPTAFVVFDANSKKNSNSGDSSGSSSSSDESKATGLHIGFGPKDTAYHGIVTSIGAVLFDQDLLEGNYIRPGSKRESKYPADTLEKAAAQVALSFNSDHPFVQWCQELNTAFRRRLMTNHELFGEFGQEVYKKSHKLAVAACGGDETQNEKFFEFFQQGQDWVDVIKVSDSGDHSGSAMFTASTPVASRVTAKSFSDFQKKMHNNSPEPLYRHVVDTELWEKRWVPNKIPDNLTPDKKKAYLDMHRFYYNIRDLETLQLHRTKDGSASEKLTASIINWDYDVDALNPHKGQHMAMSFKLRVGRSKNGICLPRRLHGYMKCGDNNTNSDIECELPGAGGKPREAYDGITIV